MPELCQRGFDELYLVLNNKERFQKLDKRKIWKIFPTFPLSFMYQGPKDCSTIKSCALIKFDKVYFSFKLGADYATQSKFLDQGSSHSAPFCILHRNVYFLKSEPKYWKTRPKIDLKWCASCALLRPEGIKVRRFQESRSQCHELGGFNVKVSSYSSSDLKNTLGS